MVSVMDNDEHIGPFNIGNPGEFTMIELAEMVREVVNPNVEVRPGRAGACVVVVVVCLWGGCKREGQEGIVGGF